MENQTEQTPYERARDYQRAYYLKNREKILAKRREYYLKNRDRIYEYNRDYGAWRMKNPEYREYIRQYRKAYRQANPEKWREWQKNYYLRNSDKVKAYSRQYYAEKQGKNQREKP